MSCSAPACECTDALLTTQCQLADLQAGVNKGWLLICGAMVFLMQLGFATLEAGSVRYKNRKNILFKNLIDPLVAGLTFYLFGYGIAYGYDTESSGFMGVCNSGEGSCKFALAESAERGGAEFADWFFQFAFAAAASTIVSGAVAERCQLTAFFVYCIGLTGFIYPVVVHWGWSGEGWLVTRGYVDFAGSGLVHMVGGTAGLVGAALLGPRIGRFSGSRFSVIVNEADFAPSSTSLQIIGTFLLWFGWYGFNPGSSLALSGGGAHSASLAALTTTVAPAAAGITMLLVETAKHRMSGKKLALQPAPVCNGILAGLVGITAGADKVTPASAVPIGIIACLVYCASSKLLKQLKIDDPLDASPVHLFCGAWGVLAVAIFPSSTIFEPVENQFGWQLAGVVAIFAFVSVCSLAMFVPLKLAGYLRVAEVDEIMGLDIAHHGGPAAYGGAGGTEMVLRAAVKPSGQLKIPAPVISSDLEAAEVRVTTMAPMAIKATAGGEPSAV